jgi:hypothetical protein
MPRDFGTWSLIIAVVTLVLTVPLNMAANLASPKVKDWWAARSTKALNSRLEILRTQEKVLSASPPPSLVDIIVVSRLNRLSVLIEAAVHTVIVVGLMPWMWIFWRSNNTAEAWAMFALLMFGDLAMSRFSRKFGSDDVLPPLGGLDKVRESIAAIERKLGKHSGQ